MSLNTRPSFGRPNQTIVKGCADRHSCIQSISLLFGRRQLIFKSLPLREYNREIVLAPLKGTGAVGVFSMKFIETANMHNKQESGSFN